MTDWFEVLGRDGPGRLGELRIEPSLNTPAAVDDVVHDGGSLWSADREVPATAADRLTILPHRGMPTGTRAVVQEAFTPETPAMQGPTAVVVSPEMAANVGADAYVLSGLNGLMGDARRFIGAITSTRMAIPSDTALYAPGVATPATLPLMVYAGIDLVDRVAAEVTGMEGRYLLSDGASPIDQLTELPCACEVCVGQDPNELDRASIASHNVATLEAAIAHLRDRIRAGRLREYLEGQVRHIPWLTAGLRILDAEWGYLEPRTPVVRQGRLDFTTDDALRRVEVLRYAERVTQRFIPRLDDRPLVLLPCSRTKPYSDSPSHRDFREAIDYRAHIVSLTSPLGVVPDELELVYPAQHYEVAVTGRWSANERTQIADILASYLDRAEYPRIIAHVPAEGYRAVIEQAVEEIDGPPMTFTVDGHPRDEAALSALREALEGTMRYPLERRLDAIIRGIADVQFGEGAGDALFETPSISGRYPRLRVDEDGDQLATLVQQYGQLALTLAGAERWLTTAIPVRRVSIEAFVPHGSVLAPGVVEASDDIRVGDEVIVDGPTAFGVGRATMSGQEMVESSRGIAVDVRHVRERR